MSSSSKYREILEFLNKNKLDLLILQDQITEKSRSLLVNDEIKEITSNLKKPIGNLEEIIQSCDYLIDFWTIIHTMSGGLRVREVLNKLQNLKALFSTALKSIGLNFLRTNQARPISSIVPLRSIDEEFWSDLMTLLHSDQIYIRSAQKMRILQRNNLEQIVNDELKEILKPYPYLSEDDKNAYRNAYRETRISIDDYFKTKSPDQKTTKKIIPKKPPSDEQPSDFDDYQVYLQADERELARMKRTGEYSVRKRGKKRKRSNNP